MVKNERLSTNIITPTTKAEDHDVSISPDEVCMSISIPYLSNINAFKSVFGECDL